MYKEFSEVYYIGATSAGRPSGFCFMFVFLERRYELGILAYVTMLCEAGLGVWSVRSKGV